MLISPDFYDKVVDACPPEMRHEIRKLDGRTGRAMRRKKEREVAVENIESIAFLDQSLVLEGMIEIERLRKKLNDRDRVMLRLRYQGYKYREIAERLKVGFGAVHYTFIKAKKIFNKKH